MNVNPLCVNPGTPADMNGGMDMNVNAGIGMIPYPYLGALANNPGMYGMVNYGHYSVLGNKANMLMSPMHEAVQLTKCVLYPPKPNELPTPAGEKPPGCKIISISGIPENATEEMMKEVFQRFGDISTVQMCENNVCRVTFSHEGSVDATLAYSGYQMNVEGKNDEPNSGRLCITYAEAREQPSPQRSIHGDETPSSQPSAPSIPPYSEEEAESLAKKLSEEATFQQSVVVLIAWLERGECNPNNSRHFYNMIHSTNNYVRLLLNERVKYEDELHKAQTKYEESMRNILLQFTELEKLFNATSIQKVWDHFSRPQRGNLRIWRKNVQAIKAAHMSEAVHKRVEDEMEVSDDESNESLNDEENSKVIVCKQLVLNNDLAKEIEKLQEENESLRCQLEASQNELLVTHSEIVEHQQREKTPVMTPTPVSSPENEVPQEKVICLITPDCGSTESFKVTEHNICLIGLISIFLHIHPFGASIDYICSYLQMYHKKVVLRDVEALMKQFPSIFVETCTGIGSSIRRTWTYHGLRGKKKIKN